jgi:hypothetical protein
VRDQNINSELLALQAQVASKDRDLSETRQKCLAASVNANHDQHSSRCRTETSFSRPGFAAFVNPNGDYETELTSIAEEKSSILERIDNKEKERRQWHQQLDQLCLGTATREPNANAH